MAKSDTGSPLLNTCYGKMKFIKTLEWPRPDEEDPDVQVHMNSFFRRIKSPIGFQKSHRTELKQIHK